jgi:hypothetical protein
MRVSGAGGTASDISRPGEWGDLGLQIIYLIFTTRGPKSPADILSDVEHILNTKSDQMAMYGSPKTSFLLTLHPASPRLTYQIMEHAGVPVDEIVSTYDQSQDVYYAYILTRDKIREEKLQQALASNHNIKGSSSPEHKFITSNTVKTFQLIEAHPAFRLLMIHEASGNVHFNRWCNETVHRKSSFGYGRLKNKLGITTPTTKGIYVLHVGNRPKPFFYVGKADDIERRIKQHSDGEGAYCISGEHFTSVEPITKGSVDDMESWERNEVLTRMYEFGIDNVRGWMYTFKTMPVEQKVSAFDQICEKFDFCRKCGRNSHFIRDCHSLSTDLWTCGMELRPTYSAASAQDSSRRIAEAQQMVASAVEMVTAAARVLAGEGV